MPRRQEGPPTWADAASQAKFTPYEITNPAPDYRWAGGYGWGSETVSLDIMADFPNGEVQISTDVHRREVPSEHLQRTLDGQRRMMAYQLLQSVVELNEDGPLSLPIEVSIHEDNRTFLVTGEPVEFEGFGTDSAWTGMAVLNDGTAIILKIEGVVEVAEIDVCQNTTMSDHQKM